jgi:hypothetical protein
MLESDESDDDEDVEKADAATKMKRALKVW